MMKTYDPKRTRELYTDITQILLRKGHSITENLITDLVYYIYDREDNAVNNSTSTITTNTTKYTNHKEA